MISSPHTFIVEIDPEFYYKNNMKGEKSSVYIPQEGTKFQILPKHGTLINTIDKEVETGITVYFHHFALSNKFTKDRKTYVSVQPHELIAYESGDDLIGYARIVAQRHPHEKWVENEKRIIKLPDVPRWESHKFTIINNPTSCPVDVGDVVWIYTNTDYIIEHMQDYSFLQPEKIVYNETKDEMLEPWLLVKSYDSRNWFDDAEKVGSIYVPTKQTRHKNEVVIEKGRNGLNKGDRVIVKRTSSNKIPMFPDANIIDYSNVGVCLTTEKS